jgi:hypothetical protein
MKIKRTQSEPEHVGVIAMRVIEEMAKEAGRNYDAGLAVCGPTGPVPGLARRGMTQETRPEPSSC